MRDLCIGERGQWKCFDPTQSITSVVTSGPKLLYPCLASAHINNVGQLQLEDQGCVSDGS